MRGRRGRRREMLAVGRRPWNSGFRAWSPGTLGPEPARPHKLAPGEPDGGLVPSPKARPIRSQNSACLPLVWFGPKGWQGISEPTIWWPSSKPSYSTYYFSFISWKVSLQLCIYFLMSHLHRLIRFSYHWHPSGVSNFLFPVSQIRLQVQPTLV